MKDLQNIKAEISKLEWRFDIEQAQSLRLHCERCPETVLLHKEFKKATATTKEQPFMLGWTSEDLLKLAVDFAHEKPLSMDSTFATNNMKVRMPSSVPQPCKRLASSSYVADVISCSFRCSRCWHSTSTITAFQSHGL